MTKILKSLLITGPLFAGVFLWGGLDAAQAATVNCDTPNASIQKAVDNADGPTTIYVNGICAGDVSIVKDDITLSGNRHGIACDRDSPGGDGTIEGMVTVKSARARIEFLTITGPGDGVLVTDRATVELDCNDISDNAENGVNVLRSSNAILTNNTLRGNGTRTTEPFPYFDCGLGIRAASSALSMGNTYEDNQYCAITAFEESTFRSGGPLFSGESANPAEMDTIVERGCDFDTGNGCDTDEFSRVAIDVFNGGNVDLRNTNVGGEMRANVVSSFRIEGNSVVKGNILLTFGSTARVRNRDQAGQSVAYTGRLRCDANSFTWGGSALCGQTCNGPIPGSCGP
jgi:parallel beta-helix repeat protein